MNLYLIKIYIEDFRFYISNEKDIKSMNDIKL